MKDRPIDCGFQLKEIFYKQLASPVLALPASQAQFSALSANGAFDAAEIIENIHYALYKHEKGESVFPPITSDNIADYRQFTAVFIIYEFRRLQNSDKPDEAKIKHLKEIFESYNQYVPQFREIMDKGLDQMQEEKFEEALHLFNCAVNLYPEYPDGFFNRGTALGQLGNLEAADADLSRTIEIAPDNPLGYRNRAMFRARGNNFDGAISDYTKIISLEPKEAAAYFYRGNLYFHAKQMPEQALEDFKTCARLEPRNEAPICQIGVIMQSQKHMDAALRAFNLALNLNPSSPQAYAGRGVTYMLVGDKEKAAQDFAKAKELDPAFEPPDLN